MNRWLSVNPLFLLSLGVLGVAGALSLVLWIRRLQQRRRQSAANEQREWHRLALELGSVGLGSAPGVIESGGQQSRVVVDKLNRLFERWRLLVSASERLMQRSRSAVTAVRRAIGELRTLSVQQRRAGLTAQRALTRLLDLFASADRERRALEQQALEIERCCSSVTLALADQTDALLRVSELLNAGRQRLQGVDRQVTLIRDHMTELAAEAQRIDVAAMNSRLQASRETADIPALDSSLSGDLSALARTLQLAAQDVSVLTETLSGETATVNKCLDAIDRESRAVEMAGLKAAQHMETGRRLGRAIAAQASTVAQRTRRRADKLQAVIDIVEETERLRRHCTEVLDDTLDTLGGLERLSDELDSCLAAHRPASGLDSGLPDGESDRSAAIEQAAIN